MGRLKDISGSRGFKVAMLAILILLFLIPVSMIRGIIRERMLRAAAVEQDIMSSWGEEFAVQGPALRIPGTEYAEIKTKNERGEEITETRESAFVLWLVPETLNVRVGLETETKTRGIFSVPLFSGQVELSGDFDMERLREGLGPNQKAFPEQAELVIALASQRGIRNVERAEWNGKGLSFLPGNRGFAANGRGGRSDGGSGGIYSPAPAFAEAREAFAPDGGGNGEGIHGSVPAEGGGKQSFSITMGIQGGKSLRMIPLGENSVFDVKADWPAPSFQGSYLPLNQTIDETGFEARWEISHLSRNIPLVWTSSESSNVDFSSAVFGVNFFKVLDHYDTATRAVKYALLFIVIPFLSLFLFEIFARRQIHPVQYLLSGIGNAVFYLLLLSFSEHIPFFPAYGISALAVTAMMTLYSRSLLGSWSRSWAMACIMALCYAFLYFTLQSEDWALLIGSIGCFGITAAVMFLTRRLDWYSRPEKGGE